MQNKTGRRGGGDTNNQLEKGTKYQQQTTRKFTADYKHSQL